MTLKDALLDCRIVDGQLQILIGIHALAFAAKHNPSIENEYLWDETTQEYDESRFEVTDPMVFAKAVRDVLIDELGEDGSSLLTNMFDEATNAVIENGADGLFIKGVTD